MNQWIAIIGNFAYGPFEKPWHAFNYVFKWIIAHGNNPEDVAAFKKARLAEQKQFTLPSGLSVSIYPLES